ncbi:uncharacterized protein C11orf91 homolog [Xenopus tropicalis]|uniref:Uncharacterized protein C11orf91 homolog n=1 Tax=Xenopus tropicalis TaxID=8364 RepID=A0A1B8XSC4_XENTR|nr:uncharacterized protein C11orf91 homolog [Xenopus tropicalis]
MSQKPLDFFPSLYDKSSSTPSEDIFSTWKKIWAALKEGSRCMKEAELSPPWPSGLAKISYDPLTFFSSTQCRGATPNYIDLGDISDLQFQMKEEELLKIIGEEPGPENYEPLEAIGDKTGPKTNSGQGAKDPTAPSQAESLLESDSEFS